MRPGWPDRPQREYGNNEKRESIEYPERLKRAAQNRILILHERVKSIGMRTQSKSKIASPREVTEEDLRRSRSKADRKKL